MINKFRITRAFPPQVAKCRVVAYYRIKTLYVYIRPRCIGSVIFNKPFSAISFACCPFSVFPIIYYPSPRVAYALCSRVHERVMNVIERTSCLSLLLFYQTNRAVFPTCTIIDMPTVPWAFCCASDMLWYNSEL